MAPDSQGSDLESVEISWRCKLPDRDKLDPVLETVIAGSQARRFLWNPSKCQRTPTLTLAEPVTLDCSFPWNSPTRGPPKGVRSLGLRGWGWKRLEKGKCDRSTPCHLPYNRLPSPAWSEQGREEALIKDRAHFPYGDSFLWLKGEVFLACLFYPRLTRNMRDTPEISSKDWRRNNLYRTSLKGHQGEIISSFSACILLNLFCFSQTAVIY